MYEIVRVNGKQRILDRCARLRRLFNNETMRITIKGYITIYNKYYPTVTGGGGGGAVRSTQTKGLNRYTLKEFGVCVHIHRPDAGRAYLLRGLLGRGDGLTAHASWK